MFTLVSKNLLTKNLDLDYYKEMLEYLTKSVNNVSDEFLKSLINTNILCRGLNSSLDDLLPLITSADTSLDRSSSSSSVAFIFSYNNIYVKNYPTLLTILSFSKWVSMMDNHQAHTLGQIYGDQEKSVKLLTMWLAMNGIEYYKY